MVNIIRIISLGMTDTKTPHRKKTKHNFITYPKLYRAMKTMVKLRYKNEWDLLEWRKKKQEKKHLNPMFGF